MEYKTNSTKMEINIYLLFTIIIITSHTFITNNYLYLLNMLIISFFTFILYAKKIGGIKEHTLINKLTIMWVIYFLYFFLNIILFVEFQKPIIIDLSVYISCILLLLLTVLLNNKVIKWVYKLILINGLINAGFVFIQILNVNIYYKTFFNLFSDGHKIQIIELISNYNFVGATHQSAFLAGFIVVNLGILVFRYRMEKRNLFLLIGIILMISVLIMSGKRAHILFFIFAYLLTHFFTESKFKFSIKKILNIFVNGLLLLISILFIYYLKKYIPALNKVIDELKYTFMGFINGEDISNGRLELYGKAIEMFKDSPLIGNGWRSFSENSVGIISNQPSHTHNIYLQLLSEMGLIGLFLFLIPIIYTLHNSIIILKKRYRNFTSEQITIFKISIFYQFFFILYGFTGNVLTDYSFIMFYFLFVAIVIYMSNKKI